MPTTSKPASTSNAAVADESTPPDMATTTRLPRGRSERPSNGISTSVLLVEPGGLNRLEDLLVGLVRVVGEARQLLNPFPQIGKPQVDHVGVRMRLGELDRDLAHIGPFQGHGRR